MNIRSAFSILFASDLLLRGSAGDISHRELQDPGEFCLNHSKVTCKVVGSDLNGRDCALLQDVSWEDCGDYTIELDYKYCNDMIDENIDVVSTGVEAKFKDVVLEGFDTNDMPKDSCRNKLVTRTIDTCSDQFSASYKVQGWVEGNTGGNRGYYCYAWDFFRLKFQQRPEEPEDPVDPNEDPTNAPIKIGEYCDSETEVDCKIVAGEYEGSSCEVLQNIRWQDCALHEVEIDYTYCNNMLNSDIDLLPGGTVAKWKDEAVGIDKSDLAKDTCRSKKVTRTIDSCQEQFSASYKGQGWVKGFRGKNGYYCYAWDFLRLKFKQRPPGPTPAPAIIPDTTPTKMPVQAPKPPTGPTTPPSIPEIKLTTECFGEKSNAVGSGIFDQDCQLLAPGGNTCMRDVKLIYTIKNKSGGKVKIQGLVSAAFREYFDVSDAIEDRPLLLAGKSERFELIRTIDVCKLGGREYNSRAVAFVASIPSGMPGNDDDTYSFTIPKFAPNLALIDTQCVLQSDPSMSCEDYAATITDEGMCTVDVMFEYQVQNQGIGCENINSAMGSIESSPFEDLGLACSDKKICAGQIAELYQDKTVNICSYGTDDIDIDLKINNDADNAVVGKYNFGFDGLIGDREPCTSRPDMLLFKLKPMLCKFSKNYFTSRRRNLKHKESDGKDKGGKDKGGKDKSGGGNKKFMCTDYCDFDDDELQVRITSADGTYEYFDYTVSPNDTIEVKGDYLPTNMKAEIINADGRVAQSMTFHTSCSQPLSVGDTFGSLKLIAFKNDKQGLVD